MRPRMLPRRPAGRRTAPARRGSGSKGMPMDVVDRLLAGERLLDLVEELTERGRRLGRFKTAAAYAAEKGRAPAAAASKPVQAPSGGHDIAGLVRDPETGLYSNPPPPKPPAGATL